MYLTTSRPDIMFAVCLCARYQANPNVHHLLVVKKIMRYLKQTLNLGLWYTCDNDFVLTAYSDSDYGGCKKDFKSTSGVSCTSQVVWIQQQLRDYGLNISNTPIFVDNSAAIAVMKNPVNHSKTKHIGIKYHFIRDCYEKRLIDVVQIGTTMQRADLFTKAFDKPRFNFLLTELSVKI
ncbi:uncharacterized mitochondrial protein AtMg00240-like [Rutidosis leptorrhynchoides]|uniref:uncharacterized mitochondrial protein AtMg00240-like n=1 Tax=Rutidosis leptorrhynchoides TaxID=125765 RepID=UPI003A99BB32